LPRLVSTSALSGGSHTLLRHKSGGHVPEKPAAPAPKERFQVDPMLDRPGTHAERASTIPDLDILASAHFGLGGCYGLLVFHACNALAFKQASVLVQKKQTIISHHPSPMAIRPFSDTEGTTGRRHGNAIFPSLYLLNQRAAR
jgi:hypothetical protein